MNRNDVLPTRLAPAASSIKACDGETIAPASIRRQDNRDVSALFREAMAINRKLLQEHEDGTLSDNVVELAKHAEPPPRSFVAEGLLRLRRERQ